MKEKTLYIETLGNLQQMISTLMQHIAVANIEMSNNNQAKSEEFYENFKHNLELTNKIIYNFEQKDKYIKELKHR
jgi:hypothetical protein